MKSLQLTVLLIFCAILISCEKKKELATVTTISISNLSTSGCTSGGNIISDGGASVTARGVCWSTTLNPTVSNNKTSDGTGTGTFTSSLSGLDEGTGYHIRAYATNSVGTAYGNDITFTTIQILIPTVTTDETTSVTSSTAISGGNVTDAGNGTITARGVCWSTTQSPTTANSFTSDGTGTGTFTSSLTGLTAGTTYYVRAYATNSAGTGYGLEISFKTLSNICVPTLLTPSLDATMDNGCDNGSDNISWHFDWSDCAGATSYNLYVIYPGASIPAVDVTVTNSEYTNVSTGYVADASRSGWTWRVRAMVNGFWGDWSNDGIFNVEPVNTDCPGSTVNDFDANIYHTITIGTQVWLREDLKTTHYSNGDLIGTTAPSTKNISSELNPSYEWPAGGDEIKVLTYGRVYTYYAIIDNRSICPVGWHVPTDTEWSTLTSYLGGEEVAGDLMKEAGSSHWLTGNTGTNTSGFTALPTGGRSSDGIFTLNGSFGDWWSSTETSSSTAVGRYLYYTDSKATTIGSPKNNAYTVRCIKD